MSSLALGTCIAALDSPAAWMTSRSERYSPRSLCKITVIPLFLVLFGAITGRSQAPSIAGDTGTSNYQSYDGEHESVDLGTGNLMVSVPLLTLPGRNHLDYSVGLVFNSHDWAWNNPGWYNANLGMNITRTGEFNLYSAGYKLVSGTQGQAGAVSCATPFVLVNENGGQDSLGGQVNCTQLQEVLVGGQYQLIPEPDPGADTIGLDYVNGIYMDISGAASNSDPYGCSVAYSNGNRIWLQNCPSGNDQIGNPVVLADSNGNYITSSAQGGWNIGTGISSGGNFPSGTDTDTLARSITFNSSNHTIQYKDSNGTTQTITILLQSLTLNCPLKAGSPPNGTLSSDGPTGSYSFITGAILPDGLTYIFQYDGCGSLTKVVYPSGGYTRYVYDYTDYAHILSASGPPYYYGTDIELTAKYVCTAPPSGSLGATTTNPGNTCAASENETTYSPTVNGSQCSHSANTVTDPLGNQTVYQFIGYQPGGGGTYFCNSTIYTVESSRQIYGNGTLLSTIQTQYVGTYTPLPSQKTTILPNGLQKKTKWSYPSRVPYPTQTLEYDWGQGAPGPLLRETDVVYPTSTTGCWWRPTSKTVKDGSGHQVELTTYELDNYTAGISASGAVAHSPLLNTSFTNRCNITAIERWRNTDGATLTTRMQYDDAGNVLSSTDPLGHVTTTSYADSWGNSTCEPSGGNAAAFPTSITTGSLTTTHKYNSCSGNIASTTDPNTQTTSYTYDLMGRATLTSLPDGGSMKNCFSEVSGTSCYANAYPIQVVSTQAINASTNKVTTSVLDGIARVTESQVNNFPNCSSTIMKVDTAYDKDGRKSTVSNPYCTTSDTTYGLTTYGYDSLNRVTSVTHPDTTAITNAYDIAYGTLNCSKVTDENGNQHEKCDNGIGQMAAVLEPNGTSQSPSMETDYCYDTLNDMTLVMQSGGSKGSFTCAGGAGSAPSGARVRSFTYDSLSELLTSSNPESGSTSYTYDNDGNLSKKTDARNISINYGYDTLNRLLAKTYTNDTSGTPTACYQYGTATTNNQNGRLLNEWTQAAGTSCPTSLPSSGYLTARSSIDYDAMGRILSEAQCTPANCGTSTYPMAYGYDLAGDISTFVDSLASNHFTLTYAYDAADHLNSLQSTWNDSQHPGSLLSSPVYQAFGLTSANLGTGATLSRTFNTRGFLTNETDKQVSGGATVYSYALGYYANGNVNTANDFVTGNWTYTYDTLNRVGTGVASAGPCNGMTITWGYDPWANRLKQTASGSSSCSIDQPNFSAANTNNTLPGFTYDADGDTTTDANGNTFTYDAEGRIFTVTNASTKYIYDAEGRRAAKENSGTGAVTASYALSLGGDQLAEMNGSGAWQHSNILAMGKVYVTYGVEQSTQTTRFHMNDWLGSRRVDLSVSGGATFTCFNYPYGDGQSCSGSDTDITEQHFTGQMRDAETGNDDFGARYYASNMGRFLTADEFRNDAHPANPQSWNLYAYVHNGPLSLIDPTGEASMDASAGIAAQEALVNNYVSGMDKEMKRYVDSVNFIFMANAIAYFQAQKQSDSQSDGAEDKGRGGILSSIKKWFDRGKAAKDMLDAKEQFSFWSGQHVFHEAKLELDMSNRPGADPEHLQVDYAQLKFDEAEMGYYATKGLLTAGDSTGKILIPKMGDGVLSQMQLQVKDALGELESRTAEYNRAVNAVVVQNSN